jgi:hypothetical protein
MSASSTRTRKRQLIIHPLALAAYPILSLAAANIQQIPLSEALRPLMVSMTASLLLVGILRAIIGDWLRAGILASLFLVLFFSYGRAYDAVKNATIDGVLVGRHRYLSLLWLVPMGGLSWLIWRAPSGRLAPVNSFLNAATVVAVVLPLFPHGSTGCAVEQCCLHKPRRIGEPCSALGGSRSTAGYLLHHPRFVRP